MGLIQSARPGRATKQEIKRRLRVRDPLWGTSGPDADIDGALPRLREGNLIKRSIRDLYSKTSTISWWPARRLQGSHDSWACCSPNQVKNVIKSTTLPTAFARYQNRAAS